MSYEIALSIGFKKKQERITVSSYANNASPKIPVTWEYMSDCDDLSKKVYSLIVDILKNNISMTKSCKSPFTRAFGLAIHDVAENENMTEYEVYQSMANFVWRFENYKKNDDIIFDKVSELTTKYLYVRRKKDDTEVLLYLGDNFFKKMLLSHAVLHYCVKEEYYNYKVLEIQEKSLK